MEHDIVLIEDREESLLKIVKLLGDHYHEGDGISFNPISIVPEEGDPREAVEKVSQFLWPSSRTVGADMAIPIQPLVVILDLHFDFHVPGYPDQWGHGLKVVYQGMIERWRHYQGVRQWRHIYVRSRLRSHASLKMQKAIDFELKRYHVPRSHFSSVPRNASDQTDGALVEKIVGLALEYEAIVKSGAASEFECECLRDLDQYP